MKKLPSKICRHFPALKYKNYQLYFTGQLISTTGSWLQGVAFGWLVYELTKSPFWLGAIGAVSALPALFLSLFGGFLVDRFDRKKLLFMTQSASLILALILGLLTITNSINMPILIWLTLLSGIAGAIDNPASQAFTVDVVGKEALPSAVGLNSTIFNIGRVLGPATAGFLIALVGIGNIFLINAASFLAILVSLYFIKINYEDPKVKKEGPLSAIKEGLNYSYSHPLISVLLLTAGMGAVFSFSQATIMPVLSQEVFRQGADGLALLLSATGLGALFASLIISSKHKKMSSFWFISTGQLCFLLATLAFTFTVNLNLASIFLFFSGFGLTLQFSSIYSLIQDLVKEEYRGRVSSIYVLLFIGFSPLGNLFVGGATSFFGPLATIRLCLIITALYAAFMMFHLPKAKKDYYEYLRLAGY